MNTQHTEGFAKVLLILAVVIVCVVEQAFRLWRREITVNKSDDLVPDFEHIRAKESGELNTPETLIETIEYYPWIVPNTAKLFTKAQLVSLCKLEKLKVSGNKQQLVERLFRDIGRTNPYLDSVQIVEKWKELI